MAMELDKEEGMCDEWKGTPCNWVVVYGNELLSDIEEGYDKDKGIDGIKTRSK